MLSKSKKIFQKNNYNITALIMSMPAIIFLVAFLLIPVIYTIYYSFFKYQIIRPKDIEFIFFQNYINLFKDEVFYIALKNTIYFTILVVPLQCLVALILALMVSNKKRGVKIFRTLYYSPQISSMVVISILWTILYNSNPNTGILNALLKSFGMGNVDFLNDKKVAMNSIIFMSAWQGAGYQMMIFIAGLKAIPNQLYEAANVDGANYFEKLLYITLPNLKSTIKYVLIITFIQAMKLFTQPYIMTKGGPRNATKTIVYYIYEQGFQKGNFGYACSIASIFFIIVVILTIILKIISKTK